MKVSSNGQLHTSDCEMTHARQIVLWVGPTRHHKYVGATGEGKGSDWGKCPHAPRFAATANM